MPSDVRFQLRDATRDLHTRLDEAMSGFDLADRCDYLTVLRIHARIVPAMEALVQAGRPWSGWAPRSPLLQADIAALQTESPSFPPSMEAADAAPWSDPERWGVQYVLEGSKLGGELLARRVGRGFPQQYLGAGHVKGGWALFQAELQAAFDRAAPGDGDDGDGGGWSERAASAARLMFERFERAAEVESDCARER